MARSKKNQPKQPMVSVLMPLYNTPIPSLREAVESILNQSFSDFEFRIVNDSPDNTKLDEFIQSYDDPRIIYSKNPENIGLEASTNKLMAESLGKYIAIFDHDDISMPERLEKEVDYLEKHPTVGVVSAQFEVFGKQNVKAVNPIEPKDIRATMLLASAVSHTTAMYRKSVIKKYNIHYEKEFFPASSYRILTQLALVTDIYNLPDMLLRYRMDGKNTSIKHADRRVAARKRIQDEYGVGLVERIWKNNNNELSKVELLGVSPHFKNCRYYRATQGKKTFFIKSDAKSLENEYHMASAMFARSSDYFIKPTNFYVDEYNYLAMEWCDGVTLEAYMGEHELTKKQKKDFINDLYEISKHLRESGIVHRDITPKNLLVSDGGLKLIDFHFAVEYDNYQELDYVKNNIWTVGMMGEPFSAGIFKWDDMFSLTKIAEYIAKSDNLEDEYPVINKISQHIGERVIIPDGQTLRRVIVKQREMLRERDAALGKFNRLRGTIAYKAARKAYRVVSRRK